VPVGLLFTAVKNPLHPDNNAIAPVANTMAVVRKLNFLACFMPTPLPNLAVAAPKSAVAAFCSVRFSQNSPPSTLLESRESRSESPILPESASTPHALGLSALKRSAWTAPAVFKRAYPFAPAKKGF
jgi:hypothetical protein